MISLVLLSSLATASAAGLTATDRVFLANAVRGNNYEMQAARLALRMSAAPDVRHYASMMLRDHRKLGANVKWAVAQADPAMMLPKTVTYKQADMLRNLRLSGRNFNMVYRQQMVKSHNETYQLFDKYSRAMQANPVLQNTIRAAKPTVRMHWDHALQLPR